MVKGILQIHVIIQNTNLQIACYEDNSTLYIDLPETVSVYKYGLYAEASANAVIIRDVAYYRILIEITFTLSTSDIFVLNGDKIA